VYAGTRPGDVDRDLAAANGATVAGSGRVRYRARMQRALPDLGPRGEGWVVLQGIIFMAIFGAGWVGPAWSGAARLAGAALGIAAIAAGGSLALRAVVDLGESLTAVPRPKERARLVERGAYRMVRHPIYGGLVLGAIGWGLAMAAPLAIAAGALLGVFFDLKSRREEAWLTDRYADYPAYRSRTRKLLPWIY
jgi:protein-S-isoprenylcysteine O-methyltransferase Ste14